MHGTILIVEDDVDTADLLRDALRGRGFDARAVHSAAEALGVLRDRPVDVVLTDLNMTGMSGIELCHALHRDHPDVIPIVITGASGLEPAIAAIRAGAYDYITKPVKIEVLAIAVERSLQHLLLRRELRRLRVEAAKAMAPDAIAGSSTAIRATIDMISRVASSDATVLITGESGTGKELVARALHSQSGRGEHPFVAINCAAMPAPLLESELFGHVRGAFTDAKQSRPGLFAQAGAGTIFLDEIGEMPMEMQVKLLRVLQERRVRPVGGDDEVPLKARVITATNRDLEIEVDEKRFREDLFYRINVVPISVPPLRNREGDVLFLAQYFLTRIAKQSGKRVEGISEPAARKLLDYDWPGNVRELENCMERAVTLCRLTEITIDDLPPKLLENTAGCLVIASESPLEMITIDEMTRRYVRQVLASVGGNKTHAARVLGIDRRSLYRRLEGIKPEPEAEASPEPEARTEP
jgi:two-component system, NtrC family, response regulator HydG